MMVFALFWLLQVKLYVMAIARFYYCKDYSATIAEITIEMTVITCAMEAIMER